ncbi:MAG: hypothetical protein AAFU85_13040 [Planctomycetota bacterium]
MSAREEVLRLSQRLADDTLSDEESQRLSKLLRESPPLREEYLDFFETHAAMCWAHRDHAGQHDALPSPQMASRRIDRIRLRHRMLMACLAIATMAAFAGFWWVRNDAVARERASRVVAAALDAHSDVTERRYRAKVTWENPIQQSLQPDREIQVSTRGDEFRIEVTGRKPLAIGREADNSVWVAVDRTEGVRIAADEVGPVLNDLLELHSLRLESLLRGVLRDHDLQYASATETADRITAWPTRVRGWVRRVSFDVDRHSGSIVRLVATGRSLLRGRFEVAFQRIETRGQSQSTYRLQDHLARGAEVLTLDVSPSKRRSALQKSLGFTTRGWIIEPESLE